MTRITTERMIGVLGKASKPKIVWQRQFDHDDETLHRLARCDWDAVPDADLWCYIHDLTYVELQPDLFRHLFPACLKFWYSTLLRNEGAERGDADFHRALLRGEILTRMMTDQERQRTLQFFVDGFLDRIELERGFDYVRPGWSANAWIGRFNTLGLVAPIIRTIWRSWWAFDSPGKAVSAIKYASGLVYLQGENPIYLPWTPREGGGGPYLTEWDASIFDHVWLAQNLSFLRETLTCDYVVEQLSIAARQLRGEPEETMAQLISDDAPRRRDVISLRIENLVANLARETAKKDRWD